MSKKVLLALGFLALGAGAAIAQSLWAGSIVNPIISGTVTGTYTLGGTPSVGAGGTGLTNGIVIYSQSLTPTATSAAIQTVEQTFTVTGVATGDTIFFTGPAPTSLCPAVHARVSNANTVAIAFSVLTAAACTPASGTYKIIAIR